MAEERDLTHDPISGHGTHAADLANAAGAATRFPEAEADYWRQAYSSEPYLEVGRSYDDYAPAYELGWVSHREYGGEFDAAEHMLANDWDARKGASRLSWLEARPATRAAWQRADNARSFETDGSASHGQVMETLNDLLENARDGELGFREAAEHTKTASLSAVFGRRADTCRDAAAELQDRIVRLGGKVNEGGSVTGAAHRVWVHIRGLLGGSSDESMLNECERGEDAALARYRKALKQNLPEDVHAMVRRQFEGAQRNHDMIKALRDKVRAENKARAGDAA